MEAIDSDPCWGPALRSFRSQGGVDELNESKKTLKGTRNSCDYPKGGIRKGLQHRIVLFCPFQPGEGRSMVSEFLSLPLGHVLLIIIMPDRSYTVDIP